MTIENSRTLAIGFVTALDETDTALGEISEWIDCGINGIHGFLDRIGIVVLGLKWGFYLTF